MLQNCSFRRICFVLCFVPVFLGCAANKSATISEIGFSVTAKGTSEGISLYFDNIPEDTYSLLVSFLDITANEQAEEIFGANIYIFEDKLSLLKQSGNLLCPFARKGREYTVTVVVLTNSDFENNFELRDYQSLSINVVAGGGIYLTNNPLLNFTDENKTVTLSEMPEFSEEVLYSPNGLFQFTNFVLLSDGNSCGGGIAYWNELTYPAREVLCGTQEHFGFTGEFPVNAAVSCCLIYGNFEWNVIVARAKEEAIMSF